MERLGAHERIKIRLFWYDDQGFYMHINAWDIPRQLRKSVALLGHRHLHLSTLAFQSGCPDITCNHIYIYMYIHIYIRGYKKIPDRGYLWGEECNWGGTPRGTSSVSANGH